MPETTTERAETTARDPINNVWFILWMLGLFAMVGLGASVCMWGHAWVMPGVMLPYVYAWVSSFFVSWTKDGWPCGARTFLGLLVGGMAVLYAVMSLTVGWGN